MEGKKVLIIYAHPEPQSFCGSLKNKCVETFESQGCIVTVRDLYSLNYDPVGGPNDFTKLKYDDIEKFRYSEEQKHGIGNGTVKPEILLEQEYLVNTDYLVLVFPLWWSTVPAILKGWMDKSFYSGVAWDVEGYQLFENGKLKGKKALCVTTTGSPIDLYTETGPHKMTVEERLEHLTYGSLAFTGLKIYPTFVADGVSPMSKKEDLEKKLEKMKEYIINLPNTNFLY